MSDISQRFYDDEEAEEILRLASSMSPAGGTINRDRLMATAAELGISAEAVELAEKQLAGQKNEKAHRAEFDARQRKDFNSHLVSYLIVNVFLFFINVASGLKEVWFFYPILGWGIGLAFHAVASLNKSSGMYQEAYERWRASHYGTEGETDAVRRDSRVQDQFENDGQIYIGLHGRVKSRSKSRSRYRQ